MRRQRNMSQIKEPKEIPENQLNKMEASNLLDAEFGMLVIRMLNELRVRVDELNENFKEIGNKTRTRTHTHTHTHTRNEIYMN